MHTLIPVLAWMPGPMELAVIAIFGLLIFGKRLPEVGKSLGKSIVEFKKGLSGIESDINNASSNSLNNQSSQASILPPPAQEQTPQTPTSAQTPESKID